MLSIHRLTPWLRTEGRKYALAATLIGTAGLPTGMSIALAQEANSPDQGETRLRLSDENAAVFSASSEQQKSDTKVSQAVFETTGRVAPRKELVLNGSSRRRRVLSKAPQRLPENKEAQQLKTDADAPAETVDRQAAQDSTRPPLRDPVSSETPESKLPVRLSLKDDETSETTESSEGVGGGAIAEKSPSSPDAAGELTLSPSKSPIEKSNRNDAPMKTAETELSLADQSMSLTSSSRNHAESEAEAAESIDDKECPGAPSKQGQLVSDPDDIPLEQQPHPYDAPAAPTRQEPDAVASSENYTTRELEIHRGISETLDYFLKNPETVVRRGPWALMHASLPFGVEAEIIAGNRRVNALGWMCYNGVCAKQRMFQPTRNGFRTNVGPGVQGHEGQFLAILAQSRVQPDYPIKVGARQYSINDLVRYEMATCREHSELTFKLIGLSYYLEPDQRWRDNRGHQWNLEKMVADELAQPINGVACGGTHRLMGLSYSLVQRKRANLPITGAWARAEAYLNDYVNYTMTLQNPDGSFSTEWFEGRGNKHDVERKVQTTGHMLEWLIFTLPDEHLRSPRIQISVEYLLRTVGANPSHDWPIGPRGHALRAMALYNQRVFGAEPGKLREHVAAVLQSDAIRR